MNIETTKSSVLSLPVGLAVIFVSELSEERMESKRNEFEELFGKGFLKMMDAKSFAGKQGEQILFPTPDVIPASFVLVLGVGKKSEITLETLRELSGKVFQSAMQVGAEEIAIPLSSEILRKGHEREAAQSFSEGLLLAHYHFGLYKEGPKHRPVKSYLALTKGMDTKEVKKGIQKAEILADGVNLARDLVNTPALDMTPTRLANTATSIANASEGMIKVEVLNRKQCEKLGMGAYLAVAQGAIEEPKFIHLHYKPKQKAKRTIALVGKGVTFDSGGLSLKPADYMMAMKSDMGGAATVLGVFSTLDRLKVRTEVHGFIAATENMPSGTAIRPGDVVKAMNGKTIEILNTDAEGRLTLADAMTYAATFEPDVMIDLATLTGAVVVALGEEVAGVMSDDKALVKEILDASKVTGEKCWELPLEKRYKSLLDSDIADIRNIASSRYGGTLTAGLFLQAFAPENIPWAHIDIAGPAFAERPMASYLQKGATGFGVRTLINMMD